MVDLATVVIVPRERFSMARRSLDSICQHTDPAVKLVYVDGGSPRYVRRYLDAQARRGRIHLIRTRRYLSPNQARNLGLNAANTKYTIFIDNDAMVTPGWVDALVQCAEETGAWLVGPLYLIGELEDRVIHMAGGTFEIDEDGGRRVLTDRFRYPDMKIADVPSPLKREPTDFLEFHCMLVRTDVRSTIGPLDEQLLSTTEHLDICLAAHRMGAPVYFEPSSVITYIPPPPFRLSDVPYYLLRWSQSWNAASLNRFKDKWGLEMWSEHKDFLEGHRRLLLGSLLETLRRIVGWRVASGLERRIVLPLETVVHRWVVRATSMSGRWQEGRPSAYRIAS